MHCESSAFTKWNCYRISLVGTENVKWLRCRWVHFNELLICRNGTFLLHTWIAELQFQFCIDQTCEEIKSIFVPPGLDRSCEHDDVIKWKTFPRYWPFVRGIHRSPVNSRHKGQWRGALMFSFICVWINGWVNNREAGDLRRYRTHSDVTVMHYAIHHLE